MTYRITPAMSHVPSLRLSEARRRSTFFVLIPSALAASLFEKLFASSKAT
jgi:hypothetical protein